MAIIVQKTKGSKVNRCYGNIDGITINSKCKFILYGSVRGLVSEHRTETGAFRAYFRDNRGCKKQGGYSDARVYEFSETESWEVVPEPQRGRL